MGLIDDYFYELGGIKTEYIEDGFLMYKVVDGALQIHQMFIRPEARGYASGKKMIDMIDALCVKLECKMIIASCEVGSPGMSKTLAMNIRYGFTVTKADKDVVYLRKDL